MTSLAKYVQEKDFGGDAISFPEGETVIDTEKAEIRETEVEFDGQKKKRWLITQGDKTFFAGVKIMKGIKKQQEEGKKKVKVIKQGTGKETSYIVLPA